MVINKSGTIIRKIENNQVHILLLRQISEDYWNVPKGHMEAGESAEETAKRETKEETGLDIKILKPLPDVSYFDHDKNEIVLHIFLAKIIGGNITPEDDDHELIWVPLEQAADYLTYQNMKDFIYKSYEELK